MQFRKTLGGLAVAFALASGGVAPSSVAADLKDFDFKYDLDGDRAAQPVQVFDDGHHTYFQFRSNVGLPVISAVTSAGRKV
jgi:type IV secretory pathway VirB9-like protein